MIHAEKLKAVTEYVRRARRLRRIKSKPGGPSFSLSCELVGKYFNLVERDLVLTTEGNGAWFELNNPEVLDGAYRYVTEGWRGQ